VGTPADTSHPSHFWPATLVTKQNHGDLWEISVETPHFGEIAFEHAGQYHRLALSGDTDSAYFAPCSPPQAPRLSYLLWAKNPLTAGLVDAPLGSAIRVGKSQGKGFVRPRHPHTVCVATGTGIAPICSLLLSDPQLNAAAVHVLWGVRQSAHVQYWPRQLDRVIVSPVVSDAEPLWTGKTGRVQDHLTALLKQTPTAVYACGHSEMQDEVKTIALANGVSVSDFNLNV
jgi:NAD(P)H-flavin reductase